MEECRQLVVPAVIAVEAAVGRDPSGRAKERENQPMVWSAFPWCPLVRSKILQRGVRDTAVPLPM